MLLANEVEQIARVASVKHAEARLKAERGGVDADEAMGDGVECAPDEPARVGGNSLSERARSLDYLPRRAASECEQENPFGRDALGHQPGHASTQRRGLARAGTGEDQKRLARIRGGRTLLDVEFVEKRVGVRIEHLFAHATGLSG